MNKRNQRDRDLARCFSEENVRNSRKRVEEMERRMKEKIEREKMDAQGVPPAGKTKREE